MAAVTTAPRGLQPNASLPAKVQPIPPNQTLYVTNLPSSKIQKADLRTALYLLFSTYGPVLDVVALKTMKMRGQAHIVFRDVQSATQAMRSLEGQAFLGRDLVSGAFPWWWNQSNSFARKYNMRSPSPTLWLNSTALSRSLMSQVPPTSSRLNCNRASSTLPLPVQRRHRRPALVFLRSLLRTRTTLWKTPIHQVAEDRSEPVTMRIVIRMLPWRRTVMMIDEQE
ncbi:U2 small nuclear ribonucleoprotein B'' [Fusarium oxysporum f. sp. raphani 54005]|uniref:U2 small nuclear ribonucleoprotein B n=4 Tax=Fusarium oxysporum TaxID=5507 RepID=X0CB57_FUSOX|nr:U2 small nuclear ribonucleoprotein B'' [Fusarium oxysporum f. sp. pisi HDV247]EXK88074.1 U2 small nuclear ribonucleoprotein B'' [Fusarium oxysporum f. sp. raphani 54005]EXL80859.1 U2 small nuclear ribonucleoprotein B'' [Fusarium oxysporum f. sp. conglutinans race 2 54008]EXM24188.1 U2 small nuclear ribonucleoprotein B'' [Fusarium oxysporum f. sp. vasinfectum 25433]EXA53082.1 U2 small nuclear ribonucleoprotein B'' [Fusarium oxysporum f. sp. pisi HDV247]